MIYAMPRSAFSQYFSPPKHPQRIIMPILCLKDYDNRGQTNTCVVHSLGSGHLMTINMHKIIFPVRITLLHPTPWCRKMVIHNINWLFIFFP